ncbi:MAG: glutamate-1-semialdehyde 2,1-aminomutase [Pseudohongiellaceae bacterium]
MTNSGIYPHSQSLFEQALKVIPGGVNSPVRAFKGVGGTPVFFSHAEGAWVYDEDGNRYIDYIGAWGPLILGHRHPKVIHALQQQLEHGLAYGAPTARETDIAGKICATVPSIESVRLVNSGTEATMSAIRLARGFTGRDKIVKFEGCYHGHVDSLLVKAGSGALTMGSPDSLGVPAATAAQTYILPYNDLDSAARLFAEHGDEIACVIVEPVAGNMNLVLPAEGFLSGLRDITNQYQSLLIFDEVMTGFRVAAGGAQELFNVSPDLTTLGKVIGGGLPVGAFGGRREIMEMLAPAGPVYQAGTLSGNPLAVAAGLVMLEEITRPGFYESLTANTAKLLAGLTDLAKAAGIPFTTAQAGAMFGCFFSEEDQISTFNQVMSCDQDRFRQYFHFMLEGDVYLAPSAFEAGFMSAAHGEEEIQLTLTAAESAFARL